MSQPAVPPRVPVCGIGASAGGVEALGQFFGALAPDLGLAYVVIVHLSPDHKSELPAILSRWTTMPVLQVGDGEQIPLRPDHVYVVAPDRQLEITDSAIGASPFEQPRGHRTAIDLFLVAVPVDERTPEGQLVARSQESGVNNWTLVCTSGHEMPSLAAGLMIICG